MAQYDDRGYVVVPDLVPPDLLARVVDEIDRCERPTAEFLATLDGGRFSIAEADAITFTTHVVARSRLLADLARHPRVVGICADLLGPDMRFYWDQAAREAPPVPLAPGQRLRVRRAAAVPHGVAGADRGHRGERVPRRGAGFHRLGTLAHHFVDPLGWECLTAPAEAVTAEVPAGGAVVFSSLTPRLTGPNTTGDERKAYIVQYAPDGAEVVRGDPASGAPSERVACDAAERQFRVLARGRPVAEPG